MKEGSSPPRDVLAALIRGNRGLAWCVAHVESNVWLHASQFVRELNGFDACPWSPAVHGPEVAAAWQGLNRLALEHGLVSGVGTGPAGIRHWGWWRIVRLDDAHVFGSGGTWDPKPSFEERWPHLARGRLKVLEAATALLPSSGEPLPVTLDSLVEGTGRSRRSVQRDLKALETCRLLTRSEGKIGAPWLAEFCQSRMRFPAPTPDELEVCPGP